MIHPTAVVHPDAQVHPEATVGPMCIIGPDVRVGRGTNLIGHVWVEGPTVIGEDNQVFPFACLGGPSQTRSRPVDAEPMLVIGDRNQIRETVTIHRGSTASSTTRIGDDCLIMASVHIGHDCVIGNGCVVSSGSCIAGHCRLDDFVNLSGMVFVVQNLHVGTHAFVTAMVKVDHDVPPYTIADGLDGMAIRGVNLIGLRRRNFPRQTLRHIVDAVRVWTTRTDLSRADRLQHMEARHGHLPEVKNLVDFLTTRGALPNARQPSRLPTAGRLLPPTQRPEVPSPPG
ncbi:acyl-ACP--UDP-N-acetylglucosamine O-acyltransferase [Kitasatospora sp. NPDC127116]|uniref:acyl-ACP--UDP-N-acetylglucosamine O-acyltransferase n=1 Tax=Kitasatospora sp. NPDC127116 TaxID=3345367 RepID=UPI00363E944E